MTSNTTIISFLYIHEYGKVNDICLNFNPSFRYNYSASKKEISISRNTDFSNRFYQDLDAKIVAISAIIGANGVGKTTILNFIKNNLTDGVGGVHAPCLVGVYHPESDSHTVYCHIIDEPVVHENSIIPEFSTLGKSHHWNRNFRESYYSIDALDDLTFINYSGFLDLTQNEGEFGSSFNITTTYLAYNSTVKHTSEDKRFNLNEIEIYRTHEIEKQLRFYFDHRELLPFSPPEYLQIKINYFKSQQLYKNLSDQRFNYEAAIKKGEEEKAELEKYSRYIKAIDSFNEKVQQLHSKLTLHQSGQLDEAIYSQLLISFLYSHVWYIGYLDYTTDLLNKTVQKIEKNKITNKEQILTVLFDEANIQTLPPNQQAKSIDYQNILPTISKLLEICNHQGEYDNIELNEKNREILKNFFVFQSNNSFANFVDFFWPLSSGQQTLFSIYSRFYDVAYKTLQFENLKIKDNILIILDEAEIALHPEWQRSFLDNFLKVISQIFSGKKIQIILTSHSPFLISDLVNSQINFIEYDELKKKSSVVENPMLDKKSTFGANISTLLHDAFFMKNGFLGGSALSQMDKFIDFILHANVSDLKTNYQYIDWFINQIGEPLIKNKIIHLLENRLSVNLLNTQDRLDEVEKRLNKLEDPNDDKN